MVVVGATVVVVVAAAAVARFIGLAGAPAAGASRIKAARRATERRFEQASGTPLQRSQRGEGRGPRDVMVIGELASRQ